MSQITIKAQYWYWRILVRITQAVTWLTEDYEPGATTMLGTNPYSYWFWLLFVMLPKWKCLGDWLGVDECGIHKEFLESETLLDSGKFKNFGREIKAEWWLFLGPKRRLGGTGAKLALQYTGLKGKGKRCAIPWCGGLASPFLSTGQGRWFASIKLALQVP